MKEAQSVGVEAAAERSLARSLEGVTDKSVKLFLSGYGKVRTKTAYMSCLKMYKRWLVESKGIMLTFDELVLENLKNVFDSRGSDIGTKRAHMDLLNEYLNDYLVKRGLSESRRNIAKATVFEFYKRNDAALYGHFEMAAGPMPERQKPLAAKDIREVMEALPLQATSIKSVGRSAQTHIPIYAHSYLLSYGQALNVSRG
jgi:hypothetical protein